MAREIKFSLVYRDMWQSSGKYQPRIDQLVQVAPAIVRMGCFDRIETNGGAFEQVNLMYGENPNKSVRAWTKEFNKAGIQTHMLERALNGLRMYGVPKDVRQLMPKVKKAQGVDIMRSFCGLNDPRNLELSVKYAKEAGMISQAALSITYSPIHTVEYYMGVVDKLVAFGADEIALAVPRCWVSWCMRLRRSIRISWCSITAIRVPDLPWLRYWRWRAPVPTLSIRRWSLWHGVWCIPALSVCRLC